ncbi:hypothetical protein ACFSHT_25120 [Paraburkholderia silviterrae]|uniref:Uncharacterized protein n=1 Tax=Paraburkholderia silviterrae TaxID=2528715 RepID=A0A4R5MC98_9BURK|nr:hypothetical protein [Paraburkholderia silviterrae]TDG24216.1 hypothetical protein EYW47_12055 [Paraburkholderia silviterrae]
MLAALSSAIAKKRKSPENRAKRQSMPLCEKNGCVLAGRKMLRISGARNVRWTSVQQASQ